MKKNHKDYALQYGQRGWKVFPLHSVQDGLCSCGNLSCSSAGKHPKIREWQASYTNDELRIANWWNKWPQANIGLATGFASGVFVLDIDPRNNGNESLQRLIQENGILPNTLRVKTGGNGLHFYFKMPNRLIKNRCNLLPGVDIKGEGGYVVAPPSSHSLGLNYYWLKEGGSAEVKEAPSWLLKLCLEEKKAYQPKNSHLVEEGGRNDFLFREASRLRRFGYDESLLLQNLKQLNAARCQPPLPDSELFIICSNVMRYPAEAPAHKIVPQNTWREEPKELDLERIEVPFLNEKLLPECFKPWVMDISERMQVTPEFVMAPAIVGLSSIVGRKLAIHPKQKDDWLVVPNLWGAIVARPGFFKSPTIHEAMKPLDNLIEKNRKETMAQEHNINANQMVMSLQLENLKDNIKRALKDEDFEKVETLKEQLAQFEEKNKNLEQFERRYKTNDATVEKVARLLNENPNGLLLLRDELNGWLQTLNKAGREGDREFYLESWNGYGSYTVDRVGTGTIHVPALCLSIFGGIQPGKLQTYVEKTMQGNAEDDGLLQRFQILIYPELSLKWRNIDRTPNMLARDRVFEVFRTIDLTSPQEKGVPRQVRFCEEAQGVFDTWRVNLESRLRSNEIGCSVFESHLAKYRKLMPSLALLFWVLENPNNIKDNSLVSLEAAQLAVGWCDYLEHHALKVYKVGQSAENSAINALSKRLKDGQIYHKSSVRSIYRKQWTHLKTPKLVEYALEALEEHNWVRVVQETTQGGKSKKVMLHPRIRGELGGMQ